MKIESGETELRELDLLAGRLGRQEITRREFRAHSVHYGVYTQRQPGLFFARIRIPFGVISLPQLETLAQALERWHIPNCHLTTRQGLEIHGLSQEDLLPFLRALARAGLLSHETGGNSIRSIMACPHANLANPNGFDLTAYAAWLTHCFLRHPDFQRLPRKMKIGLCECPQDCTHTVVQDLGFQARTRDGQHGFRVLAGGGTGALPRLGQVLFDFIPADQIPFCTEAVLRVFNRLGDRKDRRRARLKFVLQTLGLTAFRDQVQQELNLLKTGGRFYPQFPPSLPALPHTPPDSPQPFPLAAPSGDPNYEHWLTHAVQVWNNRTATVRISFPGGSVSSSQLRHLAHLAAQYQLSVRTTPEQAFLLRDLSIPRLPALYEDLSRAGLVSTWPFSHLVVCPGASYCSNAFTDTQALAGALADRLKKAAPIVAQWRLRVSGCGNGCALHALADIGLEGVAHRTPNGSWIPNYKVWLGGREDQDSPQFGNEIAVLPARVIPEFLADLADYCLLNRKINESFGDLYQRLGAEPFKALAQNYSSAPKSKTNHCDWGATGPYKPPGKENTGAC